MKNDMKQMKREKLMENEKNPLILVEWNGSELDPRTGTICVLDIVLVDLDSV